MNHKSVIYALICHLLMFECDRHHASAAGLTNPAAPISSSRRALRALGLGRSRAVLNYVEWAQVMLRMGGTDGLCVSCIGLTDLYVNLWFGTLHW